MHICMFKWTKMYNVHVHTTSQLCQISLLLTRRINQTKRKPKNMIECVWKRLDCFKRYEPRKWMMNDLAIQIVKWKRRDIGLKLLFALDNNKISQFVWCSRWNLWLVCCTLCRNDYFLSYTWIHWTKISWNTLKAQTGPPANTWKLNVEEPIVSDFESFTRAYMPTVQVHL